MFPILEKLRDSENLSGAEKLVRQALVVFEQRAANSPTEPSHQAGLAAAHNNLGDLIREAQPQAAEKAHRQAIAIYEQLISRFPANTQHHEDLGHSYRMLAHLLAWRSNAAERERLIRQAAAQFDEAAKLDASASRYQERRLWLADTHRMLADELLSRQPAADPEPHYRTSLDIIMTLTAQPLVEARNVALMRHHLNLCFGNYIQFLAAASRTQEVQQVHQQAIALYEKLAEERPDEPYFEQARAKHQAALSKLKEMP